MRRFEGLVAAVHSPFQSDGELALEQVEKQCELLCENRVAAAFVGGTTGESASLTADERLRLTRKWCEVAGETSLEVFAHVGHNSAQEARGLAADAAANGASAIALMAPSYFRPRDVAALVEFFAVVAANTGDTPIYFYDIPALTGVSLPTHEFMVRVRERVPSFAGVKYTNPDLAGLQRCRDLAGGEFDVLFGCDEALLAGLALGVRGAVGSTYNFAAPLYHSIIEAFDGGDLEKARRVQKRSVDLVDCLVGYGFMAAAKFVMTTLGVDCGPVRTPLDNLSAAARARLTEELESFEGLCTGV